MFDPFATSNNTEYVNLNLITLICSLVTYGSKKALNKPLYINCHQNPPSLKGYLSWRAFHNYVDSIPGFNSSFISF